MVNVGSVETWNREYLTIKISVKGYFFNIFKCFIMFCRCIQDFSGFEGRNSIYRNLLHLLIKKYPFIKNSETNSIIKVCLNKNLCQVFFRMPLAK